MVIPIGTIVHLILSDQNAALIFPLEMLALCLALKDARFFFIASDSPFFGAPAVLAPCSPNRIVFILSPTLATTMWDFFGWLGVRLGLL
jgi:hypothetical protein